MNNRLTQPAADTDRVIAPPGNSDEERAQRVRFWLDRGNQMLAAEGRTNLCWAHSNGHYFITDREAYLAERRHEAIKVPSLKAA